MCVRVCVCVCVKEIRPPEEARDRAPRLRPPAHIRLVRADLRGDSPAPGPAPALAARPRPGFCSARRPPAAGWLLLSLPPPPPRRHLLPSLPPSPPATLPLSLLSSRSPSRRCSTSKNYICIYLTKKPDIYIYNLCEMLYSYPSPG